MTGQIGRYEIVRKTGTLALDEMYEAFDPVMQRAVTIRIADGETQAGTQRYSTLEHPNIVKVLAVDTHENREYLVLEQVEGTPLRAMIAEKKVLARDQVARLLVGAAAALDFGHSKGLVRCDLTPESILVGEDEAVKIAGFESARSKGELSLGTEEAGDFLPSLPYMSPEAMRGDALDARADQFSLATVAIEALTGARPFPGNTPVALMRNICFEPPAIQGDLPANLKKILERALSKQPSMRFSTCTEFARAFETALSGRVANMTRVAPAAASVAMLPKAAAPSSRIGLIVACAALAVVILAAVYFISSPRATAPPPAAKKTVAPQPAPANPANATPSKPAVVAAPKRPPSGVAPARKKTAEKAEETAPLKLKSLEPKVVQP